MSVMEMYQNGLTFNEICKIINQPVANIVECFRTCNSSDYIEHKKHLLERLEQHRNEPAGEISLHFIIPVSTVKKMLNIR